MQCSSQHLFVSESGGDEISNNTLVSSFGSSSTRKLGVDDSQAVQQSTIDWVSEHGDELSEHNMVSLLGASSMHELGADVRVGPLICSAAVNTCLGQRVVVNSSRTKTRPV